MDNCERLGRRNSITENAVQKALGTLSNWKVTLKFIPNPPYSSEWIFYMIRNSTEEDAVVIVIKEVFAAKYKIRRGGLDYILISPETGVLKVIGIVKNRI